MPCFKNIQNMVATGSWIWKPWIKFAVPDLSVPKSNWCQFNADVFALAIFRFPDLCLQVCVPICQVDLSVRSCVFCAEIKHERFQMIEGITEEASYLRYNSWNLWVSKKVPAFKPWRLGLGQDFRLHWVPRTLQNWRIIPSHFMSLRRQKFQVYQ